MSTPIYHNPIFLQADFNVDPPGSTVVIGSINLGIVTGDTLYYQFLAYDYEGNTLRFAIFGEDNIPGQLTIDPITGWLSGNIDRDNAADTPYEFRVSVYKNANSTYQTSIPVSLTIKNPRAQNIIWTSPSNLGNLIPGIPSSLRIQAEVQQQFSVPSPTACTANCTMKLVGVSVVDGGNNFSVGNSFTVSGGICTDSAIITVSNVSAIGSIQEVTIQSGHNYIQLPPLTETWSNPNTTLFSDTDAHNAVFNLNFGVDQVDITDGGSYYDTATIGFGPAGAMTSAKAIAIIQNGIIQEAQVTESGSFYQAIPEVKIQPRSNITESNPISFSLVSGQIPTGLKLLSNGLLVGIPSTQYFDLDSGSFFNETVSQNKTTYTFTVMAAIATNDFETIIDSNFTGDNSVVQANQILAQMYNTFNITLDLTGVSSPAPKTNLSLEFLLDNSDLATLYAPLKNENIIPHESIFREGDFYFGIAPHVRMLIAYGINSTLPDNIISAMAKYHHNKSYLFTNLKLAYSSSEGYEVIYIQPRDIFTNELGQTFSGSITSALTQPLITADSDYYNSDMNVFLASNISQSVQWPATLSNMVNQLNQQLSAFDQNFLPSWMSDSQPDGSVLGFIPAIPLIYVNPGQGQQILYYLQQYYNNIGPALNTINAETDRYIWNFGYCKNWSVRPIVKAIGSNTITANSIISGSSFYINLAKPILYTSELIPRTYSFTGNTQITFSSNMSSITNVIEYINKLDISGLSAKINSNDTISLENTYGAPFWLYDGLNTPLYSLGLVSAGNSSGYFSNLTPANWNTIELTEFDILPSSESQDITTETNLDLETELGDIIYSELVIGGPSTQFADVANFFDVSDMFLEDDEGSIYLLFGKKTFINQPIITG